MLGWCELVMEEGSGNVEKVRGNIKEITLSEPANNLTRGSVVGKH